MQKDFDMVIDEESIEENISVDDLAYSKTNWYYMYLRGVYIGDYFYTVNSVKEICSWKMGQDGFLEKEQLELR